MVAAKTLHELNGKLLPSLYDLISTKEYPIHYSDHKKIRLQATDICAGYLTLEWDDKRGHQSRQVSFSPHLSHPDDVLFRVVQLSHPDGVDTHPRRLTFYRHWECAGEASVDCVALLLFTIVIMGLKFHPIFKSDFTMALDEWLPSIIMGFQAAHAVELVLRLIPRLKFFRVPPWPCFLWTLATFVGGVVAIRRFDRSVQPLVDEQDLIGELYNLYG